MRLHGLELRGAHRVVIIFHSILVTGPWSKNKNNHELMAVPSVGVKILLPEEPMAGLSPRTGAQGIVVYVTLLMAFPPISVW